MKIAVYIIAMAAVTYLIRCLPLTLVQGKIENRFMKSFLHYVPYACLMAMTFPAVFYAMDRFICCAAGVAVAIVLLSGYKQSGQIIRLGFFVSNSLPHLVLLLEHHLAFLQFQVKAERILIYYIFEIHRL